MASVWLVTRAAKDGSRRYRCEFRTGGRESATQYGGSFRRRADAEARKRWISREFAEGRVPNLRPAVEAPALTVAEACERWQLARIDVADSTKTRNGLEVDRIGRQLGSERVDELTPSAVAGFVAALAESYSRATIRKNLQTLQMVLDHAGLSPNPARDRQVRLPRGEVEEINPPSAEHVEAVYRLLPSKHRLPLLWLDWSGARVSSVDLTLVGDYDEPRRRVRLRGGDDEDAQGVVGRAPPGARRRARVASRAARGSRPAGATVRRQRCRRAANVDREGLQGGGDSPLVAPRPTAPPDQPLALARRGLGEDRRVRRAAQPVGDGRHLLACARRRA